MDSILKLLKRIFLFYSDGFKDLSASGRKLWVIIIIKLIIIFAVLKIFFFPDFLDSRFTDDEQKIDYVKEQLIKSK